MAKSPKVDVQITGDASKLNAGIGSAKTGLAGFKAAIGEADGAGGKLSAGFANVKSQVIANAGALSLGAGAALIGFGIKAVGAFEDVSKKALDLGASTGLAVEDASRWIAIGDDFGVGADALQGGIGKIAKSLDDTKWAEYGIATRDAGGEARDTNDILLDSFDMLSNVKNETERARIGNQLFGKGYSNLAPLIGHTRAEYEKMLGSVEKGQVITEEEAKKAEKMRLAQDDLHDALQEVTLAVGEMVAEGAPLISFIADAVTKTLEFKDALDGLDEKTGGTGFFSSLPEQLGKAGDAATNLKDRVQDVFKYGPFSTTEQQKQQDWADHIKNLVVPSIDDLDRAHKNLATGGMSDVEYQEKQNAIAASDYAAQVDKTNREVQADIQAMEHKWDELHGNISKERALINYRQSVEDTKQAMIDAGTAAKKHGVGSPEHVAALEAARLKQLDLEDETADLAQKYTDMPAEKVTKLIAQIDQGNLDNLGNIIQNSVGSRTYRVNAHVDNIIVDGETHAAGTAAGGIHVGGNVNPHLHASGTPNAPGGWSVVGEQGPELLNLPHGAQVIPAAQSRQMRGGGNTYVNINMPVGTDPKRAAEEARRYYKRTGRSFA